MCGIVGFSGKEKAVDAIYTGLKHLEYRGYDSAGIAVNNNGSLKMLKASGNLENLKQKLDSDKLEGPCGIGHTRWATHGAPTDVNAHPHLSSDGKFAVVHNGIIENYIELKEELIKEGYKFLSETDTEVIVHLLEHYYNGNIKEAFLKTVSRLEGSYAIGVICSDNPGVAYAAKYFAPLIVGVGNGENLFASDVTAIIGHTKNVIYLEDGEFAEISKDKVTIYDFKGNEVKKEISKVEWDVESAEKGGYEHFMLKEIMEQPKAIKSAIEPRIKNGRIVLENEEELASACKDIERIVISACGSAYHAGYVGRYIIEELCKRQVKIEYASELRYSSPVINEKTLTIVVSQSGETADTIAALKECKARGSKVLAIVNVVGSSIAKLADFVLYTYAGPEIAVATTKGYTTQVAVFNLFAVWLADKLKTIDEKTYASYVDDIMQLPERIQRSIYLNPNVEKLARKYYKNDVVFFIGRNLDYAVGLEASLKLKEISYLHSEAYAAGELKHGTIALIEQGSLVVALACRSDLYAKTMSNVKEVKARGANVVAVTDEDNKDIFTEASDVILIPKINSLFVAACEVVPLQLFSYYIAKERGCDIDKPKNLAKSVTVE